MTFIVKQNALQGNLFQLINDNAKMQLLTSNDLARIAREERVSRNLTQEQVATIVAQRSGVPRCTRQAISQAESAETGSKMDGLRIKIIEALTGRKLKGPLWHFEDRP